MMGGRDSAALLSNMIRMSHAKKGIEIGTFTGFTTLAIAEALPSDGIILTLDIKDGEK